MQSPDPSHLHAAAVLSVILDGRHGQSFALANRFIDSPDAFTNRLHRLVWLACQRLSDRQESIDTATVTQELASIRYADAIDAIRPGLRKHQIKAELKSAGVEYDDTALAAVGGFNAVSDLAMAPGGINALESNATALMEHYKREVLVGILEAQIKALSAPDGVRRSEEISNQTVSAVLTLVGKSKDAVDLATHTAKAGSDHDKAQRAEKSKAAKWGVDTLDIAAPLDPSRLVILSAPRSCGKTSLALQAIEATAKEHGEGSVALVSLEMPAVEIAIIIAARKIGVQAKAIRNGMLTATQRQALDDLSAEQAAQNAVSIKDAAFATNMVQIRSWAKQLQTLSRGKLRLLVIDHLQALAPTNERSTEYARISEATAKAKIIANELEICVLLLSQLSRAGTRQEKTAHGLSDAPPEPQLSDLRGSGTIEQDADTVVMLWPNAGIKLPTVSVIAKVAKSRQGDLADVPLEWARSNGQLFRPLAQTGRRTLTEADHDQRAREADEMARMMIP